MDNRFVTADFEEEGILSAINAAEWDEKSYNEDDHPRDEHGRWTDAGGGDETVDNESGNTFLSSESNVGIVYNVGGSGSTWLAKGSRAKLEKDAIEAVKKLGGERIEYAAIVADKGPEAGKEETRVALISGDKGSVAVGQMFAGPLDRVGAHYSLYHNHPKPYPLSDGDIACLKIQRLDFVREDDMKGGWSSASLKDKAYPKENDDFGYKLNAAYEEAQSLSKPLFSVQMQINASHEVGLGPNSTEQIWVPSFFMAHAFNLALDQQGIINYKFHMSDWHQKYLDRFKEEFAGQLKLAKIAVQHQFSP